MFGTNLSSAMNRALSDAIGGDPINPRAALLLNLEIVACRAKVTD